MGRLISAPNTVVIILNMGKLIFLSLCLVLLIVLAADGKKNSGSRQLRFENSGKSAAGKPRRQKKKENRRKSASDGGKRRGQMKKAKRKGPSKKSQSNDCSRQSSSFCPAEKALSLKILYGQVSNFFRQLKRAENHAKIVSKKKGKKDNFMNDAAILQDAVGGNFSAPSCASSGRSASSAGEKGQLLANCTNSIGEACADIAVNTSLLGDCKTTMENFETKITTCKTDDSCTCWTEAVAMKAAITDCKATDEMNRVKALKSHCLSKFGDCKKAQDSAVEFTASCPTPSVTTMSGITTMAAKRRKLLQSILAKNIIRRNTA